MVNLFVRIITFPFGLARVAGVVAILIKDSYAAFVVPLIILEWGSSFYLEIYFNFEKSFMIILPFQRKFDILNDYVNMFSTFGLYGMFIGAMIYSFF